MIGHPAMKSVTGFVERALSDVHAQKITAHLQRCQRCRERANILSKMEPALTLKRNLSSDFTDRVLFNLPDTKRVTKPTCGEIKVIRGCLMVYRNGADEGMEAFPRMAILKGDTLRVIGNSLALIELNDGSSIYLNKETEIRFFGDNYPLSLRIGELFAMMKPQRRTFEIWTPSATLGVVGTDFDAQISKKNETILKVLKGKVSFKNQYGQTTIIKKRQVKASKYTEPKPTKIKDTKSIIAWAKPMNPRMKKKGGIVMKRVLGLLVVVAIVLAAGLLIQKSKSQETTSHKVTSPSVTVTVSGKVRDAQTGQPIPNALVRGHIVVWRYYGPDLFEKCPYQEMKTGVDGAYKFTFITPLTDSGRLKEKDGICVYASASGYETKPVYVKPYVTIHNTNFPNADIELGSGKLVKGKVVDDNNKPIEGAVVRVRNGLNGDWNFFGALGKTYTNENGEFEVWCRKEDKDGREIISTNPWLHIFKQGYGVGHFFDILKKEDMGTLVIPRGGTITGRVTNAKGKGIANCEVCVRSWGGKDEYYHIHTDAEGKYVLKGVPGVPSIVEFYKRKNPEASKKYPNLLTRSSKVEVYARLDPKKNLQDCPHYQITAKEGETITAPDLVIRK